MGLNDLAGPGGDGEAAEISGLPPAVQAEMAHSGSAQDEPSFSGGDDADPPAATSATADPVKDYLRQIVKVPLLSAGQEVELAKRIEAGLFAEQKLAEGSRALSAEARADLEQVAKDGRRAKV